MFSIYSYIRGYILAEDSTEPEKKVDQLRILEQSYPLRPQYYSDQDANLNSTVQFDQPLYQYNSLGPYQEYPSIYEKDSTRLPIFHNEPEPEPTVMSYTLKFMGRLAGFWFVTVAAGSVLCSIPVSAFGLPVILGFGVTSLVLSAFFSWLYRLWIKLLILTWKVIRLIVSSPRYLISFALDTLKSTLNSIFAPKIYPPPVLPIQTRRFSNSPRLTNRSDEIYQSRWRYYGQFDNSRFTPSYSQLDSPTFSTTPSQISGIYSASEYESKRSIMNPQFILLHPAQKDRLDFCKNLYKQTNPNSFDLTLGKALDGSEHMILSLWDEPDVNLPLLSSNLIGFCQYFVFPDRPGRLCIDKLNVAPQYSETGFSKLIIRKLMNLQGVQSIQVWSVWQAEVFYKGLGFRSVVASSEGKKEKRNRILGEFGPLLMWSFEKNKDSQSNVSFQGSSLSRNDSMMGNEVGKPALKSKDSKDSMTTVVGEEIENEKK